jgi:hypothetical protein
VIGGVTPAAGTFTSLGISALRPAQRPIITFDFANGKKLDTRITFTRNSVGTYLDVTGNLVTATANQPRFNHANTLQSLGLLIEESRINIQPWSFDMANQSSTAWSTVNSSTAVGQTASPDGTAANTVTITDTVATDVHGVVATSPPSVTNSAYYAASVFAKAGTRTQISLIFDSETAPPSVFDLTLGTVSNEGTVYRSTIIPFPNGWYRCVSVVRKTNTSGGVTIAIASGGSTSYTGTGTDYVHTAFFQLEQGYWQTTYIPTGSAAVTRAADVATITGSNFRSVTRGTQAGIMVDARLSYPNTDFIPLNTRSALLSWDNGTASERVQLLVENKPSPLVRFANLVSVTGGAVTSNIGDLGNLVSVSSGRIGAYYGDSSYGISLNANAAITSLSGAISTGSTQLSIGSGPGVGYLNGTISKMIVYGNQITTSEARELSRQ